MAWKNVQYENGKLRTSEGGGGGGSSTFADLDDVSFSNIQNGQVPKYNSTTQKWENANESGGGGTTFEIVTDTGNYSDNITITLLLTKKYINPYVFPINYLPLSSWSNGARVVAQTDTVTYDSVNNQISFKIYVSSTQNYKCDWMIIDLG